MCRDGDGFAEHHADQINPAHFSGSSEADWDNKIICDADFDLKKRGGKPGKSALSDPDTSVRLQTVAGGHSSFHLWQLYSGE